LWTFGGAFLILGRHDMPSFLGMGMGMGDGWVLMLAHQSFESFALELDSLYNY
jgi:hypothetical protein